jgi:hypothetical protein
LIPTESPVEIIIKDLDVDFSCYFKLDEKGYLDPVVFKTHIDFGETAFNHDNWFVSLTMYQTF